MLYDIDNVKIALGILLAIHIEIRKKAEIGNNLRAYVESDFAIGEITKGLAAWNSGWITRAFIFVVEPKDSISEILYMKTASIGG
jgi:hypothetical protein